MPKAVVRCRTYSSNSTKLPVSTSISMRSRAVILPLACCFCWAIFSGWTTASSNRARRSAILAAVVERSGVSVTDSTLSSGAAGTLDDVYNGVGNPLAGASVCGWVGCTASAAGAGGVLGAGVGDEGGAGLVDADVLGGAGDRQGAADREPAGAQVDLCRV